MDKTFLLRFDNVSAIYENTRISHLRFDIKPKSVSVIQSPNSKAIYSLILGSTLPDKGTIALAGVNITDKNENERRVSALPSSISEHNIKKLLRQSVNEGLDALTSFEQRRNEKKNEEAALKAKLKKSDVDTDKLKSDAKKVKIDYTVLGFKMKRRKKELESNLDAAGILLAAVNRSNMENKDSIARRLIAKEFSASYELAMFTHKRLPDDLVNERIDAVIEELKLSEKSSDIALRFACAYVKAPVLIAFCGEPLPEELQELSTLAENTGVAVAVLANEEYFVPPEHQILLDHRFFSEAK